MPTKTKLPAISEKEFMSQVIQFAKLNGWLVYHTYDSRRSTAGFPDLVLVRSRALLFAELKVGNRKCTPSQEVWIDALAWTGRNVFVWRPGDWPEIANVLGGEEKTANFYPKGAT